MITVSKVSMNIDFQENEIMPLLHGTLQLCTEYEAGLNWLKQL